MPGFVARLLTDALVVFHLAFILFVLGSAVLVLRWPRLAWLHLPCAVWGALVELLGWVCPLTPLESELRERAGLAGYAGGFVEHYLIPVLYPEHLTRGLQIGAAAVVLAVNVLAYRALLRRRRGKERR